jgi:hypothetical protein
MILEEARLHDNINKKFIPHPGRFEPSNTAVLWHAPVFRQARPFQLRPSPQCQQLK